MINPGGVELLTNTKFLPGSSPECFTGCLFITLVGDLSFQKHCVALLEPDFGKLT